MTEETAREIAAAVRPVDQLEVLVVVDNVLDLLSTVPEGVTGEMPNLLRAGLTEIGGPCVCCAHWGLSLLITAERDGQRHSLLFDAGPEAYAVERNGERLGVEFGAIEAVVLSHGHWDHGGGLPAALERIAAGRGNLPVDLHVNPGMFRRRAMTLPDGRHLPLHDVPPPETLAARGARVVNSPAPRALLDGFFYLSGEIPRVTPYEKGLPGHMARNAEDSGWEPDPWIRDERYLAVPLRDEGVIVFTACSHAGVVNVLRDAAALFAPRPLHAVMGGFHLSGAACEAIIPDTVRDLRGFGLKQIVPGHCTGWRATHALLDAFGEEVVLPSAVGRRHLFRPRF